jgi:hypothetical protein
MGLLFPKEELMRWKEPSNYQQEKSSLTLNAALFLIGFNVIAIVVLWFTSLEEGKKGWLYNFRHICRIFYDKHYCRVLFWNFYRDFGRGWSWSTAGKISWIFSIR